MTKYAVRLPALLLFGVALAIGLYVAAGPVSAAPPDQSASQAEHARIIEFWTPERVAAAVPRDLVVDGPLAPGTLAKPDGVGGSNGGGKKGGGDSGDTSTAVTGAPWTGGDGWGTVKATTGKVLFTLGFTYYVCSGTVVDDGGIADRSFVLTAGHCVYDESTGIAATNWMFIPDFEFGGDLFSCAGTHYGCWTAEAYATTRAWTLGDLNADYAFAVMRLGGMDGTTELDVEVGSQVLAINQTHPTEVYAFGYPHASPYDGSDLIYCAGTDAPDTWGGSNDYGLHCDMTGGSSGGAWYANFDEATGRGLLTSVNSFRYLRGPAAKNMYGPYFDDLTERTLDAAKDITIDENSWTVQLAVVW